MILTLEIFPEVFSFKINKSYSVLNTTRTVITNISKF